MFFPVGDVVPLYIKLLMVALSLFILIATPLFPVVCMNFFKRKNWIRTMLRDVKIYWNSPRLITKALFWSLLFHVLIIAIHFTIGHAMSLDIPIGYYFILYPVSAIAGFVPFTFNGIGPREGAYIYFLSLIGIKSSAAIAFGVFWFGIVLCSSLIGGFFYIKEKHSPPPEEFEFAPEEEYDEMDSEECIEG